MFSFRVFLTKFLLFLISGVICHLSSVSSMNKKPKKLKPKEIIRIKQRSKVKMQT